MQFCYVPENSVFPEPITLTYSYCLETCGFTLLVSFSVQPVKEKNYSNLKRKMEKGKEPSNKEYAFLNLNNKSNSPQHFEQNEKTVYNNYKSRTAVFTVNLQATRKPLRVLSLFDGISAGYVALKEANLVIEKYFASEIDKDARRVSSMNSMGEIYHLGAVEEINKNIIKEIGPIDLLIGGSPCVDLSLANPGRKGLFDSQGTGKLFFEYIRILHLLRMEHTDVMFLFENTAAMPRVFKNTISRFIECEPVKINAKAFSPQIRARYFWGNIPNMKSLEEKIDTTNIRLGNFLDPYCNRTAIVDKIRTITTNFNSLSQGKERLPAVFMDGQDSNLWITEIERIFGFAPHYTDVGNLSLRKRLLLLGNSWSVPTVKEIFYPLRNYYLTE